MNLALWVEFRLNGIFSFLSFSCWVGLFLNYFFIFIFKKGNKMKVEQGNPPAKKKLKKILACVLSSDLCELYFWLGKWRKMYLFFFVYFVEYLFHLFIFLVVLDFVLTIIFTLPRKWRANESKKLKKGKV